MVVQSQFIGILNSAENNVEIGDVLSTATKGKTPQYVEHSKVRVMNQACVHWDGMHWENVKYQDPEKLSNKEALKSSDILLNSTGTCTLGRCNIFFKPDDEYTYIPDGHLTVLSTKQEVMRPWILVYFIKLDDIQREIYDNCVTGSTNQVDLVRKNFLKIRIPLPDMASQILFDKIVAHADKSKFDGLKSQFIARFGTTDCSPFPVKSLREISLSSGEYGANTLATKYNSEVGRYIRITDIDEFGNLNNDIVSPEVAEDKYLLREGDLLFARTGATVGKTYLHKEGKALYAGYLIKYRFTDAVLPDFVFAYTHSQEYYKWVELTQKVGAQPNISAKQYDGLKIIVPPIEEQKPFVSLMHQADKSKYLS